MFLKLFKWYHFVQSIIVTLYSLSKNWSWITICLKRFRVIKDFLHIIITRIHKFSLTKKREVRGRRAEPSTMSSLTLNYLKKKLSVLVFLILDIKQIRQTRIWQIISPLSANSTKWLNTLKQFVGNLPTNCLSVFDHFVKLALKGLTCSVNIIPPFPFHSQTLNQPIYIETGP